MKAIGRMGCALVLLLAGCASVSSTADIPAVTGFDSRCYRGDWHVIARLPNVYEAGMRDVVMSFRMTNGRLVFTRSGMVGDRKRVTTAYGDFIGAQDVGEFQLKLQGGFQPMYRIIWLSPNYDQAIVAGAYRDHFWILAREKEIPQADLDKLVKMAADWNFDTTKLEYPQRMK